MQLVVSGNRILAHGEGFLAMGGTVINTNTGRVYQNATVVTCDGCPSDIDKVGYEYHAGQFVPCAPFGVGDGNFAVVCGDDCKSIKDSGIPLSSRVRAEYGSYVGTNEATKTITVGFRPQLFMLVGLAMEYFYFKVDDGTTFWFSPDDAANSGELLRGSVTDTGIQITAGGNEGPFGNNGANASGETYHWIAFG